MGEYEIPTAERAVELHREHRRCRGDRPDLEEQAATVVEDTIVEYSDVLSFDADAVHCDAYESWGTSAFACVTPVGVTYIPEGYEVLSPPPKAVVHVVPDALDHYAMSFDECIRHELAHFEDWRRRQETDEYSETFRELCHSLDAKCNDE